VRFAADGPDFADAYAAELRAVLAGGEASDPARTSVGRALAGSHTWDAVAARHVAAYASAMALRGH
jgi:hypothetical protein